MVIINTDTSAASESPRHYGGLEDNANDEIRDETTTPNDENNNEVVDYVVDANQHMLVSADTIDALKSRGNAGQRHPSFLSEHADNALNSSYQQLGGGGDSATPPFDASASSHMGEPPPTVTLFGKNTHLTKPQLVTLCLLIVYYFMASCFYSLFAPFFPGEAKSKGLNQTQVGIIFGVFQFVLLVLSPFFGKYMEKIGIRFLFVSGLFLSSGSFILFGFLKYCPPGFIYFVLCLACRIVGGIGSSMGLSYAIVGYYFPNRVSSLVALLELFNGLGLMIGPPIGGFLYEWGGFELPFWAMGGVLFCVFILAFFTFPDVQNVRRAAATGAMRDKAHKSSLPFMPLLRNRRFLFTLGMLFAAAMSIGFIEPSIQLHLMPLGLSPSQLGFVLFIPSLLYSITTPIVGCVCDRNPRIMPWFMFVSCVSSGCAFTFFGPLPFYHLPLKLYIFLSGFIAYGFSIAFCVIPVYSELVRVATSNGYPNDLRTQGLISGAFSSTFSLGSLVGPIVGGVIVDNIGFDEASLTIVGLFFLMAFLYGSYNIIAWSRKSYVRGREARHHVQSSIRGIGDDTQEPTESSPLVV